MSDTEGALPGSGRHDLSDAGQITGAVPEASRLPARPGPRRTEELLPPSRSATRPPEAASIPPPAPPPAPGAPVCPETTVLADRLAAATLGSGLLELPSNFGDPEGDWVTVQSDNPFEVLYLDYHQAARISPDLVSRHRDLLHKFWQEKLKSMSQGAARVSILKKYGGQHQAEQLVRSYPDLIDRAYHRLSTRSGIEEAYRQIVGRQQTAVFARVDEKLNDFLLDSVLQPQETQALLALADGETVTREMVALHVQGRLRAAGLVNAGPVNGARPDEQLLSTAWSEPSPIFPDPPPAPPPRSALVTLLVFSLVVVLVLVIGAALYSNRIKPAPVDPGFETPAPALAPAPTPVQEPPPPETPAHTVSAAEHAVTTEAPPRPAPSPVVTLPAPPAVSAAEREAVTGEIAQVRTLSSADPDTALERLLGLDARLAEHPQEFAAERIELAKLQGEIRTAVLEARMEEEKRRRQEEADRAADDERNKRWERSLAQIESLSSQGNYSGAKMLADQLLAEQDIPKPIAERAQRLSDEAVEKLQKIFSGAKAKSKTSRAPDRPPH